MSSRSARVILCGCKRRRRKEHPIISKASSIRPCRRSTSRKPSSTKLNESHCARPWSRTERATASLSTCCSRSSSRSTRWCTNWDTYRYESLDVADLWRTHRDDAGILILEFISLARRLVSSYASQNCNLIVCHFSSAGSNANRHQRYQRSHSPTSGVRRADCGVKDLVQSLPGVADPLQLAGLLQLTGIAQKFGLLHQLDEQQRVKWITGSSVPKIFVAGNGFIVSTMTNDVNGFISVRICWGRKNLCHWVCVWCTLISSSTVCY